MKNQVDLFLLDEYKDNPDIRIEELENGKILITDYNLLTQAEYDKGQAQCIYAALGQVLGYKSFQPTEK
jgi:hypothetical protein